MKHLPLSAVLLVLVASIVVVTGCGGGSSDLAPMSTGAGTMSAVQPGMSGEVSLAGIGLYLGDMDNNGTPSAGDAIKILRMVVGLDPYALPADCNGSGTADAGDAIKVLRCVTGLDSWPMGTTGDALVGEWMGIGFAVVPGSAVSSAQDADPSKSCYMVFNSDGTYAYHEATSDWHSGTWDLVGSRLDMHVTAAMPAGSIGETFSAEIAPAGNNFTATFEIDGGIVVCETFERLSLTFPEALAGEWLLKNAYSVNNATSITISTAGAYSITESPEETEPQSATAPNTAGQQLPVRDMLWEQGAIRVSQGGHMLIMPGVTDDPDGLDGYSYAAWELSAEAQYLAITDPDDPEVLNFGRRRPFPTVLSGNFLLTMVSYNGVPQTDDRDSSNWRHMEITTGGDAYRLGLTPADRTLMSSLSYYAYGLMGDLVEEATLQTIVPGGVLEVSQNIDAMFIAYERDGRSVTETYSKHIEMPANVVGLWDFQSVQALSVGTAQPGAGTQLLVRDNGTYRMSDGSSYWEEGNVLFFKGNNLLTKPQDGSEPQNMGDGNWFEYNVNGDVLTIDEWSDTEPDQRMTFVRNVS